MAENEIDPIDVAALVMFPAAAGVIFGIWNFDIVVFGGWSPSDILFSGAGVDFTYALLAALGAVAWIIGTNEIDGSDYETWEYGVIGFSFFSVPLYVFVPAFETLVNAHDIIALLLLTAVSVAATYVAYVE